MTSIQTLQGVLFALLTVVGIALAVTFAFMAAGAVFEHDQARAAKARGRGDVPAQHPTQTDKARDLLLR